MKKEPYDYVMVPFYAFTALMSLVKTTEDYLGELQRAGILSHSEYERSEKIIALARKLQEGELHDS